MENASRATLSSWKQSQSAANLLGEACILSWRCKVSSYRVKLDRNLEVNRFLSERSLLSKCTGPSYQSWRTDSMWKHATLLSGPIYHDIASFDWTLFCWRRRLQFQSVQDHQEIFPIGSYCENGVRQYCSVGTYGESRGLR
eukprot:scaffold4160_cov258-Chaetoceros_neogracile.AAC.6